MKKPDFVSLHKRFIVFCPPFFVVFTKQYREKSFLLLLSLFQNYRFKRGFYGVEIIIYYAVRIIISKGLQIFKPQEF